MAKGNIGINLNTLMLVTPELKIDPEVLEKYGKETAWWHKGHGIRLHFAKVGYVYLHNLLFPAHECVDHKDRDTTNNLLSNLRGCTKGQNNINKQHPGGSSSYRGIYWSQQKRGWYAAVQFEGKKFTSRLYQDEDSAAKHYNFLAKKHHGEFAQLNEI